MATPAVHLPVGRDLDVSMETITPRRAAEFLDSMAGHQRKPIESHIRHLARQMRDGLWTVNGEAVKFDRDGHMIDGQHRCRACIEADRAFDTLVIRNVTHEAFDRLDTGKVRSPSQILQMIGAGNQHVIAGAIRYRWLEERELPLDTSPSTRPSNHEIREILSRYPEMESSAKYGTTIGSKFGKVSKAAMAYLHFKFHKRAPAQADEFFYLLARGSETDGPIFQLRERLASWHRMRSTPGARLELMRITIMAWNGWRQGKTGKILLKPRGIPDHELPAIQ